MGRLIDADLLKENCKCTGKFEDNFKCVDLIELAKVIDNQQTAYDVEKVVAELETSSGKGYRDIDGDYVPPMIETIKAIEIVRNGGKE